MSYLTHQHILLGVTGGIAAYKAAELTRLLRIEGAEVEVVMTPSTLHFIAPLTFQALSGHAVHSDLFKEEQAMEHIRLARWADFLLVAPATANFMARLRAGIADDLLTTLCLATTAPIALAPAMNSAMWHHVATQENVNVLEKRGVQIWGPDSGELACGDIGVGRMLEPASILQLTMELLIKKPLKGISLLITAGPTREALDPVRYVSNRSSGKMGYALAEGAASMGANVTLVSGPTWLSPPTRIQEYIQVESAEEMYQAVIHATKSADIYIGAAAVADYSPVAIADEKIKKGEETVTFTLTKTTDIVSTIASLKKPPFTVGFAAETSHIEDHARSKRVVKSLDMVAGNQVGKGMGFDADENALFVCWEGGEVHFPLTSKRSLAKQLLLLIAERFYAKKNTTENT